MDRNEKFLKKLSKAEFKKLESLLLKIKSGKTDSLDIKILTGYQDIFRARSGDIRVIFLANRDRIDILEIGRRSEKTYKDF